MFSALFLVSYVVLWAAVLGMGFLLLGTLRSLGVLTWQFDEMEAIRPVRKAREGLKVGLENLVGRGAGLQAAKLLYRQRTVRGKKSGLNQVGQRIHCAP